VTRNVTQNPPADGELETLLVYIHERRNFDFRGYKRASLGRRVHRRMQLLGLDDYQRYMDVLEANPGEFAELFNTILINVTSFMRDEDAWEALAETAITQIARGKDPEDPIRAWSAGTASGEEAYTLAVILAEAVGEDRFRSTVKIYATDADTDALMQARHGRYRERDLVQAFGEQRVKRFFEVEDGYGTFRPDLRRSLIFGRHDLVQDPPISRIDLLTCRNTLMYFTSDVQAHIPTSFHFALSPGGFLFLGKSEALASRMQLFEPLDARQHIFRKNGDGPDLAFQIPPLSSPARTASDVAARAGEILLEQSPIAQVVVDGQMTVLAANHQARRMFSIGSTEAGPAFQGSGLAIELPELHRQVAAAARERRVITIPGVPFAGRGDELSFDVVISPFEDHGAATLAFLDVSRYRSLGDDLERSQAELESAYEELQSAVEELETTNEELHSTNEELETTNEELQSTNEELETMNEELQSTNEELETRNVELRKRGAEVDELNTFLQSILASLKSAVVVLGPEMEVRAWNRQAEDLWGLRADEVQDLHFLNLDIGFPVDTLGPAIRATLAGRSDGLQVTREAVNRRGRKIQCTVTIGRLVADDTVRGALLLMDAATAVDSPPAEGQQASRSSPCVASGSRPPAGPRCGARAPQRSMDFTESHARAAASVVASGSRPMLATFRPSSKVSPSETTSSTRRSSVHAATTLPSRWTTARLGRPSTTPSMIA
jgi:two-component system CheB/CheR fusion protein